MKDKDYQLIDALEANAYYNSRNGGGKYATPNGRMFDVIAEAYLMRSETLTRQGAI